MAQLDWNEPVEATGRVVSSILVAGMASFMLAMRKTGEFFNIDAIGEFFIASILNVVAIPVSMYTDFLPEFALLEWNVLVVVWLAIGWFAWNVLFGALKGRRTLVPDPYYQRIISLAFIPALGAAITAEVFDGGIQMMADIWIIASYNIFLIPSVLLGENVFSYEAQVYLGAVGAFILAAVVSELFSRYVLGKDAQRNTPEPIN